jgi:dimeric dUTPase (all-alpha-NTP-PPase superfamily)
VCILNIDDIIQKIEVPENIVKTIRGLQSQLMIKYDYIERKNGFLIPYPPYNLNDSLVQARIKDMFWRTTEELAEAYEILPGILQMNQWTTKWTTDDKIRHFFEEIADAIHFLIEASIIANLDFIKLENLFKENIPGEFSIHYSKSILDKIQVGEIEKKIAYIIFSLGLSANMLKNKPWKQTQMETDIIKFLESLLTTWAYFINLFLYLACSQKHIYVLYAKKNFVNQWRQKTNY